MGRYNFKNYERRNNKYENNDLDIDRLSRELMRPKERSTNYGYQRTPKQPDKVGVILQFMNGQSYKTTEFTVGDITSVLDSGKRWLNQNNGGAINLGYVVRYSPYKFYQRDNSKNTRNTNY